MRTFLHHAAILALDDGDVRYTDGGFFGDTAWIMLVTPFLAFLLILAFGKRLKNKGGEIAVAALATNFIWATALLLMNATDGVLNTEFTFEIADIGSGLVFELGYALDGLSIMMYWLVNSVGLVVFIYAIGYMRGDRRVDWFFAAFSLFAGAMLVLVSAPNLIQLIIGWEGVGLASYFLIGFYWEDHDNVRAGNLAFMVNKLADVGLILGAILIGVSAGTFDFAEIDIAAFEGNSALAAVAVTGGALLFLGAMGKSAQFPLHIWLPDAMAGPTPVSALMHAATMVTAGVYLMARVFPIYEYMATDIRATMVVIGTITLFAVGLLAVVANDIKKVLAYSTVSQLGYMMTAMAAGGYTAGLFHLFTHAAFKALLFLCAGSVIHAVHSNDMTDMGGLRKHMPTTFWTWIIGGLALAGIGLSGFWSKDEILATLGHEGYGAVMWISILGALVTAFYMARATLLTFFGVYKGHGEPHESPRIMTVPLIILAVPSVLMGILNIPGVSLPRLRNFTEWLSVRGVPLNDYHPESIDFTVAAVGLAAAVIGVGLGYRLYSKDADTGEERDSFEIPVLFPLLRRKYYIDDLALGIVSMFTGPLARFTNWTNTYIIDMVPNAIGGMTKRSGDFVYRILDQRGVDAIFNGLSAVTDNAGGAVRKFQTGKVQHYAAGVIGGALVLIVVFVVVM